MALEIKEDEASLGADGSDVLTYDVAEGRTFTVIKLAEDADGDFKITQIKDTATAENFLSGNLTQSQIQENGGHHLTLPVDLVVKGSTRIKVGVTDLSGASNTVKLACIGKEE